MPVHALSPKKRPTDGAIQLVADIACTHVSGGRMAVLAIALVFLASIGLGLAGTYGMLSIVLFLMQRSVLPATDLSDTQLDPAPLEAVPK
jgi:hypothetical protein